MFKINIEDDNLIVRDFTELKVWSFAHLSIQALADSCSRSVRVALKLIANC